MARNNRNRYRGQSVRLTRAPTALGHTVSRFSDSVESPFDRPVPTRPVRPLIRTVRIDSAPPSNAPTRGRLRSPAVAVRASGRSSDQRTRSPFLNAQMITPQLANRALVCASRTIRREVLFARKQTGKGARSPRRQRSKVNC